MNHQATILPGHHESGVRTQQLVVLLGGVLLARTLLEAGAAGMPLLVPQPVWYAWPIILVVAALTFAAPLAALATLFGLLRRLPQVALPNGEFRVVSLGQALLNGALAVALLWMFAVAITT